MGSERVVKKLLTHKVDPNIVSDTTALHIGI